MILIVKLFDIANNRKPTFSGVKLSKEIDMGTCYWEKETQVRRKGAVVAVTCLGNDGSGWHDGEKVFHPHEHVSGERRSRQIAKRHWLRKMSSGWCSNGGSYSKDTIKPPGKKEFPLRKSVY